MTQNRTKTRRPERARQVRSRTKPQEPVTFGRPSNRPSDEATADQLHAARMEGAAYALSVEMMTAEEAHGEQRPVDDYIVGYAVEEAEGMYMLVDGELEWHEPKDENAHIEVVVRDRVDGRFLPYLKVRVTVTADDGKEVGSHLQPYLWHPWLFHYGRNWKLPRDGKYALRIDIEPPTFHRHDRINGAKYRRPVTIEFRDVEIRTGRKESPPDEGN